ncbi:Acetyl esterase/lipase [Parasphingorhabdus marina DSM 22363]|uniref:Acetyl esterase/lipase n=1 Tax=Parasphingorhabdus marina DSM 22363 TaxID=1123272 RepID=A0A1N6D187_9SPHN|nr:alpha/beta hydrolase [Parasphingorhabdus marina]SIN64494.1 Acetyl esterase/lipase [Parasphingorhabdus marina DSM 22363]
MKNSSHIDPKLYTFLEEQEKANDRLRESADKMPQPGSVDPKILRNFRIYNKDGSIKPPLHSEAFEENLELADRTIKTRVFPVEEARGIALHFHGGGWTMGSVYEQDPYLAGIAQKTKLTLVTIDYPLAPEHQLPEILDVAHAATCALLEKHPDLPVAIVAESAGANVALHCLLRLREEPSLLRRIKAASLCYPVADLSMTPSLRNWDNDLPGLSRQWMEWFFELALPGVDRDRRSDPKYSPLYADLAGLPPVLFSVGELDPMLDDSLFMHQRWLAAGNESALAVYPAAPHGFNADETRMAKACNQRIHDFLKFRLTAPDPA